MSSARAVRCRLKCHNERNPCRQLPAGQAGDSGGTATARCEEGGDDVKSARPLRLGRHTCYNGETLEVHYKEKNIAQVLDMTVNDAVEFFGAIPKIARKLQTIKDVGLGYMTLRQQRIV